MATAAARQRNTGSDGGQSVDQSPILVDERTTEQIPLPTAVRSGATSTTTTVDRSPAAAAEAAFASGG